MNVKHTIQNLWLILIRLLIIVLWILAFVVFLIPALPFLIILRIIFYLDEKIQRLF